MSSSATHSRRTPMSASEPRPPVRDEIEDSIEAMRPLLCRCDGWSPTYCTTHRSNWPTDQRHCDRERQRFVPETVR